MILTIIYQAIVFIFTALFMWNLFEAKKLGKQISCGIALIPLILRLFLVR